MPWINQKRLTAARERLKDDLYKLLDAWQTGSGAASGEPLTLALATAAAWRRVDETLATLAPAGGELRVRLSVPADSTVTLPELPVISLRCIRSRHTDDPDVYYFVLRCGTAQEAGAQISALAKRGITIGDWQFC